ncbi:MAG: hypothetical protein QM680_02255 [Luteolibacter sp.]
MERLTPLLDRLLYHQQKQREGFEGKNRQSEAEIDEMLSIYEQLYALDAKDLKTLYALLKQRADLDPKDREAIQISIFLQLAAKEPESTLTLFLEEGAAEKNVLLQMKFNSMLLQLGKDNPQTALAWFKKHAARHHRQRQFPNAMVFDFLAWPLGG